MLKLNLINTIEFGTKTSSFYGLNFPDLLNSDKVFLIFSDFSFFDLGDSFFSNEEASNDLPLYLIFLFFWIVLYFFLGHIDFYFKNRLIRISFFIFGLLILTPAVVLSEDIVDFLFAFMGFNLLYKRQDILYPLISFFAFSFFAALIMQSNSFFFLFLSLEGLSFCLYSLVSGGLGQGNLTLEASIKYFSLGSLASSFILFGIIIIFGVTRSVDFTEIKAYLELTTNYSTSDHKFIFFGLFFIIMGFFFKLAAAPLHMGLVDVYAAAPIAVTVHLITTVKVSIFVAFSYLLMFTFYFAQPFWSPLLVSVGLISMYWGSFAALYQQELVRFFAYSSVQQMGYMCLGLATGTLEGLVASGCYLIVYTITGFLFFNIAHLGDLTYFSDLPELLKKKPILAFLLTITLCSLANMPPFAGFFTKLMIFKSMWGCGYFYIWVAMVPAILTSIISIFYYIRLIKILLFEYNKMPKLAIVDYSLRKNSLLRYYGGSLVIYGHLFAAAFFLTSFIFFEVHLSDIILDDAIIDLCGGYFSEYTHWDFYSYTQNK